MEAPRVLIISDLPELRLQLRELLREDSYEFYEVAGCVDAEFYRQRVGPRVILLDLDISSDDPLAFLEELKGSGSGGFEAIGLTRNETKSAQERYFELGYTYLLRGVPEAYQLRGLVRNAVALRDTLEKLQEASTDHVARSAIANVKLEEQSKQLEEALGQLRTKNRLLAALSHDFRAPVSVLLGFTELLSETHLSLDQRGWLENIYESAKNLLGLAGDILELQQAESPQYALHVEAFNMNRELKRLVERYSVLTIQRPVEWSYRYASTAPDCVAGDARRLGQIVANLLHNAVQWTKRGFIEVSVEGSAVGACAELILSVKDSGSGISAAKQAHIFEPFVQAQKAEPESTAVGGLGLAICKELVELMGGDIGVESAPGEGTRFWVRLRLPLAVMDDDEPELELEQEEADEIEEELFGPVVLVVDEDVSAREKLQQLVLGMGFRVELASGGKEALLKSRQRIFDAILLEHNTNSSNAFEVTRIIRANEVETHLEPAPIFSMTGGELDGKKRELLMAGVTEHLSKPVNGEVLKGLLEKHLPQPRS